MIEWCRLIRQIFADDWWLLRICVGFNFLGAAAKLARETGSILRSTVVLVCCSNLFCRSCQNTLLNGSICLFCNIHVHQLLTIFLFHSVFISTDNFVWILNRNSNLVWRFEKQANFIICASSSQLVALTSRYFLFCKCVGWQTFFDSVFWVSRCKIDEWSRNISMAFRHIFLDVVLVISRVKFVPWLCSRNNWAHTPGHQLHSLNIVQSLQF